MTIRFDHDLSALAALLSLGGYSVRGMRKIPGDFGRSADLHLSNGVVVCWDITSNKVWIDRFSRRGLQVEKYLRSMCEGPHPLRIVAVARARFNSSVESLHTTTAEWLLHSEGFVAKVLRRKISRA